MTRKIVILISLLLLMMQVFTLHVFAEKNAESQPDQTEEIRYIKGRKLTKQEIEEQKKHEPKNIGRRELPNALKAQPVKLDKKSQSSLAATKKYDARSYGLVTTVKNQESANWCWAYSMVSCMETSMIKNRIKVGSTIATKENTDLSEAALAYFMYNRTSAKDPLKLTTKDRNIFTEKGGILICSGNADLTSEFLTTGMGIKKQAYYTLEDVYNGKKINKTDAYKDNPTMLKNAYRIATDEQQIKKAIMDYGSVLGSIQIKQENFNYDTAALYNPASDITNHEVTIVGWDDSYSRKNFCEWPSRNGAWIVKNSWGTDWGDKGYFYISYQDAIMSADCAVDMQPGNTYKNRYFYDGSSGDEYIGVRNKGKVAVSYTAGANKKRCERLQAISFSIWTTNVEYSIQLYKNPSRSGDPESGTKLLSKEITGETSYGGIYTVPIAETVILKPGEKYTVVIMVKAKGTDDMVYMGMERDCNYDWVSFDSVNGKNQSFYKYKKNSAWKDIFNTTDDGCIRIKAYTNETNHKQVVFKCGTTIYSTQYIEPGKAAKAPAVSRRGYQFVKWDKTFDVVKEDMVVNAVYLPNHYNVVFEENYGIGRMKKHSNVAYDTSVSLLKNKFTRKGYTFIGWNTEKKGRGSWYFNRQKVKNLTYKDNATVTLYAQWSKDIKLTYVKSSKRGQITVKYTKTDSSQKGYEILYSTDKNFKKSKTKTYTIKGYSNYRVKINNLSRGTKYYVKVRTYKLSGKTRYYGAFTSVKTVKVKR